jgi:hypothetical protein
MAERPVRRLPMHTGNGRPQSRRVRIPARRGGGAGDSYVGPIVLRVKEKDAHGRPRVVECFYDEDVIDLENGDEFVTAFIAAAALSPPKATA